MTTTRTLKSKIHSRSRPALRFSPYAWAKLLYLRDRGDTEIGGFAICTGDDLLRVDDIQLVRQSCTPVTVAFDDESVADFFDRQVDAGLRPCQFARIWAHTHPGDSPLPSSTDEDTFVRVFGRSDWAMLFILARGGQSYARLQFHVGPGGSQELPVEIDYTQPFDGSDWEGWEEEYLANVQVLDPWSVAGEPAKPRGPLLVEPDDWLTAWPEDPRQQHFDLEMMGYEF